LTAFVLRCEGLQFLDLCQTGSRMQFVGCPEQTDYFSWNWI